MASSQVEIVSSSSAFGCVLRDRNHREGCRIESNAKVAFQRNIKNLVIDHLNTCISDENNNNASSSSSSSSSSCWDAKASSKNNNNLGKLGFSRKNNKKNKEREKDENVNETSSLASLISPRHSRVLDRWAARQAREMVSNLENEAELLSMINKNDDVSARSSSSSASDECSCETPNLGASSLVQIWEKRLNKSNGSKPTTCSNEEQCRKSEAGECFDGEAAVIQDWESDRTAQSDQSVSPKTRWCSSESDKVSVADLIKKLTSSNQSEDNNNEHEGCSGGSSLTGSPNRDRECGGLMPEHSEIRVLRIRVRRVFNDLLAQWENDRYGELKSLVERGAVSKFTQRGRIQAVLRLRLLQRGVAANNPPSPQKATASEVNKQPQGSTIMQLREKFSTGATTVPAEVASPRSPPRWETVNNTTQLDNPIAADQFSKDTSSKTVDGAANHSTESTQKSQSQINFDHSREEARPSSDISSQETSLKDQRDDSQETAAATTSVADSNLHEVADKREMSNQQNDAMAETTYDETVDEEEASNQQYAETSFEEARNQYDETSFEETVEAVEACIQNFAESSYDAIVEEVDIIDQNYDETNYDWISEISRPRSYWEERRQAWYREMLDSGSPNEDIRKLLERRTVSSFLSSDFRETMDRLMETHRGTQTHLVTSQNDVEDSQGLFAFLQERVGTPREEGRHRREEEEDETRNEENEEEDEEEEQAPEEEQEHEEEHERESSRSGSYHEEVADYYNQSSSWSDRDQEAGDDFDRVASTASQPYPSQSFYQDSQQYSSSANHHSIEMDLIYDLRGHMEQLYNEMSELRKSIKSCMEMQMQLQQSMTQEAHTVKKEEKKSRNRAPMKGNCCVCYEMKVDSVLYRCGHMCTCVKCANELQWNSGKCPICRAKIVDVVRVYVDI